MLKDYLVKKLKKNNFPKKLWKLYKMNRGKSVIKYMTPMRKARKTREKNERPTKKKT